MQSQTVSQWRGVNRDGIYNESRLLKTWPETGPKMLWFNEDIGNGYGSPMLTSDKLFINGETDSTSYLFAYDLKGKFLWKTPNGPEFTGEGLSRSFPGVRSTPTMAGDMVYICSGKGRVACIDSQTGIEKWAVQMTTGLSGIMPDFGYNESLLIDGDVLYCSPGGANTNIAALNRFTGKPIWTSKVLSDTLSYCSPMIVTLPQRKILVSMSNYFLVGLDAKTGELLWSQKQENVKYQQQCNTPIFANGFLYYVAGDGNGAVKLKISDDGKSFTEIWRNGQMTNTFNGFVKIDNHLFTPDRSQKIKCIDENTGQVTDSLRMTKGALIAAGNMLYCYSDNGEVNLIKLTGTKMETVGKLKITKGTKEHFAHPVISNGVLYIRHGKALMAFDIKEN
jgi:outer membrane protein assembly factor BamB